MAEKDMIVSETQPRESGYPEKPVIATASDDKALQFIAEHGTAGPLSSEENKRILRAIDSRLIPMVETPLQLWIHRSDTIYADDLYASTELDRQECSVAVLQFQSHR